MGRVAQSCTAAGTTHSYIARQYSSGQISEVSTQAILRRLFGSGYLDYICLTICHKKINNMTSLEFTSQVQKISLTLRPAAMNLTRDADDAKDLVQETLLKALLNKEKFKAGTNLKAWLYTIMRNTFINNYNKVTKRSSNIDSTEYFQYFNTDQNYITHNGATSDFVVRDINEAIAGLGSDYRTPFMMYYIGYKYLEIAEKLQIPIGTVKNRIHIARKELKSALQVYAPSGSSAADLVDAVED